MTDFIHDPITGTVSRTIKPNTTVRLGCTIRDATTDMVGIAVQTMQELGGNLRWGLQPPAKDNVLTDMLLLDENLIDYVDDGISDRTVTAPAFEHKLGDKLRDKVTGFEGVATAINTYINGCVYVMVYSAATKGGLFKGGSTTGDCMNLMQSRWEMMGVEPKVVEVDKPQSTRPTGGPILRGNIFARR